MSEVDQYKHQCIAIVTCPSDYDITTGISSTRNIPLYRLDESAVEWHAKPGDVLLGGGSGESEVLRISMPEAIFLVTRDDWFEYDELAEIFKAYWSTSSAFVFGTGFIKLGWHPRKSMEFWLTDHIVAFLLREYPDIYGKYSGKQSVKEDGSICRLPNPNSEEPHY